MAGGPSSAGRAPLSGWWVLAAGSIPCVFSPASAPSAPSHPLPASASPSMSHSFGESYRVGSTSGVHAITVFCSWDYKVTQKWATRLQHDNIRTQLKVSCPGALGPLSPTPCPGSTSRGLLQWERVRAALGPSPWSPRVLWPPREEACGAPAGTCSRSPQ